MRSYEACFAQWQRWLLADSVKPSMRLGDVHEHLAQGRVIESEGDGFAVVRARLHEDGAAPVVPAGRPSMQQDVPAPVDLRCIAQHAVQLGAGGRTLRKDDGHLFAEDILPGSERPGGRKSQIPLGGEQHRVQEVVKRGLEDAPGDRDLTDQGAQFIGQRRRNSRGFDATS